MSNGETLYVVWYALDYIEKCYTEKEELFIQGFIEACSLILNTGDIDKADGNIEKGNNRAYIPEYDKGFSLALQKAREGLIELNKSKKIETAIK